MKYLGLFLFAASLFAKEKIELIPNNPVDLAYYNQIVKDRDAEVVLSNCARYGAGFKKSNTIVGKWIKKLSLDFPKKIDVDASKIIWMNIPNHFYRDNAVAKLPKEKMVLFMWEPYIRLRKMYNKNLHQCFSRIYTWDDDLVDNQLYFKFYYPVMRPMIENVVPFEQKKLCTLFSGYAFDSDKYPRKYPNELYSARMEAIEFFEKMGEPGFEFYGRGWPGTRLSYRGAPRPEDKIDVMKNYRFAICYENCQGAKGYITEKIFDCFQAGVAPVYWGAPNVTDYIPADCFIDRRSFATLDDLYLFLKSMPQQDYDGYISHIRTYLESEKAQLFTPAHFEKLFLEATQ